MKLFLQTILGLTLLTQTSEANFDGAYIGGGLGTGWGTFKYKRPPHKTYYKDGTYSGMAPAEINTTSAWEIFQLSAVGGYGCMLNESNWYFGGELRETMKLMNSGEFIGNYNLIARLGYLPNNNILIYAGAGIGFTHANVNKISDGNISYYTYSTFYGG